MAKTNIIICPECGKEINIQELIEQGSRDTINKALAEQKAKFEKERKQWEADTKSVREEVEAEYKKEMDAFQKAERKKLSARENEIRKQLEEEHKEADALKEQELEEKTEQLKKMRKLQAEFEKIKREKESLKEDILAETEEIYSIKLAQAKQEAQEKAESKYELKIEEWKKKYEDQIQLTEEMKRKQEQGSQQLQGEVQELSVEEYLKLHFPSDDIKEIGKGKNGADTLHIINTNYNQNCGSVYYESKRTQTFNDKWIPKFKEDMKAKGVDIGVIVTSVYPKDMVRMGIKDGVYICSFAEFKALSYIMRETVLKVSDAKVLQENRLDKKELLYNFMTSNEFKLQIETLVNSFKSLKENLDSEKVAMARLWKQREKQLESVLLSTTEMFGSIQGIAGNSVQGIEALDFPLLEDSEN